MRHLAAFYGIGVDCLIEAATPHPAPPVRPVPDPVDVAGLQCRAGKSRLLRRPGVTARLIYPGCVRVDLVKTAPGMEIERLAAALAWLGIQVARTLLRSRIT